MGLPPPKLRDLESFVKTTDSKPIGGAEVWEIGVPPENSLYWSIALSYLLSSKEEDFAAFLDNLTNSKHEANSERNRKRIDFRPVKTRLKNFNPFKNRYVLFYDEIIMDVFRSFKWKLNNYAKQMKPGHKQCNDEMKLDAASVMLNCKIDVYLPDDARECFVSFPTQSKGRQQSNVILLQYKTQKQGRRNEIINIFRFALPADKVYVLKLSVLSFILRKVKFTVEDKTCIEQLMFEANSHGNSFLPMVLQSPHFHLMTDFYKSPHIALKLSEAGFETNPLKMDPKKPSAFLLSMTKANTKYTRILYDYAVSCRSLFLRTADNSVLDSLHVVQDILAKDATKIHLLNTDSENKERIVLMLNEFSFFNKYQLSITSALRGLRREMCNGSNETNAIHLNRKVIEIILNSYLDFFYYNLSDKNNLHGMYNNYLTHTEYYKNVDGFTFLSFFDLIHAFKNTFRVKDMDLFANIEANFLFLMISNKYFTKFKHTMRCTSEHDEAVCETNRNVLLFSSLLYREKLRTEVETFVSKLKQHKELPVPQEDMEKGKSRCSLTSLPEIRDELLISRIHRYLKAAYKMSLEEDGLIKGIFVIERALQVLGESIQSQSVEGCAIRCILGARLPTTLKGKVINICSDFSHHRDNFLHAKSPTKRELILLTDLQSEIRKLVEEFEIVAFTQYMRLEESLMNKSLQEFENYQLDQNFRKKFFVEKELSLHNRKISCAQYNNRGITLSLEVVNDIQDYLVKNSGIKNEDALKLFGKDLIVKLKTVEYVLLFMSKLIDEQHFQSFLTEVQFHRENFETNVTTKKKMGRFRLDLGNFCKKYKKTIKRLSELQILPKPISENVKYPNLKKFLRYMKSKFPFKRDVRVIVGVTNILYDVYDEALEARKDLQHYIELERFCPPGKKELLLQKLIISQESLKKLRKHFESLNKEFALAELDKQWITKDSLAGKVKKALQENSIEDEEVKTLFIKMAYQKYLPNIIYTTPRLNDQISSEIDDLFRRKTDILLNRISAIKTILIDEDEEIKETWKCGKNKGIKPHMRFLMRERFLMEMSVRASLEMVFFDCLNVLESEEFKLLYEELNNPFTGINLRNVLSHGYSILEIDGEVLKGDDLPSKLISEMLNLVEDSDVIRKMYEIIRYSGTLQKDVFKAWIENYQDEAQEFSDQINYIKMCPRWTRYLILLPLI